MLRYVLFILAAALLPAVGAAQQPRVGETYEITMVQETSQKDSDGGGGSSHDKDTLVEKVIAVRPDGVELEYDLPKAVTAEERASDWKFPARVFKPNNGALQLLNRDELEARVDRWLKDAKWPRTVCGHWIFTWNAFQIDCDPESVIKIVQAFDLRSADVRDGASYKEPEALTAGTLTTKSTGPKGAIFTAAMPIDPDAVHRANAESDVVVGEIMKKPVTLEAAVRERSKETVSGNIEVTLETDANGRVWRRTRVTRLETKKPDGGSESQTVTQTLERKRISGR